MKKIIGTFYKLWNILFKEVAKFGTVGTIAFIIDSCIYIWLLNSKIMQNPIICKTIASIGATIFSYYANRLWTFKDSNTCLQIREFIIFFIINGIATLLVLFCIIISHYVLSHTSKYADFISGNIVGLIVGTFFRFFAYRSWVFKKKV